jgi:hypothetical protein
MHQYGSLVLAASKDLLRQTHHELMIPLGDLAGFIEDTAPDWGQYKRNQRAADRRAQAMALIEWNRRRKERRDMLREIGRHTSRSPTATIHAQPTTIIEDLVAPFSDKGNRHRQFETDLKNTTKRGVSHILPWRQVIIHQITEGASNIDDLNPVTGYRRLDRALHFQFVNELAHHGQIQITQDEHLGKITLAMVTDEKAAIHVRDRSGMEYIFIWRELNTRQRQKIFNDLHSGIVVMVRTETEND